MDSYENFLEDMGECPPTCTIDRKDTNGNYEPSNCQWSNPTTQARNRNNNHVVTIDGVTACITEFAIHFGIRPGSVFERIRRGWSVHDALTVPMVKKVAGAMPPPPNQPC